MPILSPMAGSDGANGTLEAIVESANDAIITADATGMIVTWNPAAARLFGHTADEAIGRSLTMIVPPRFRQAHHDGLARVAAGGETHIIGSTVRIAALRKDGSEFPVDLSLATWVDNGERFFSGILRDVTEQAELARQLASSQQRLEAVLDSANDAIVSIDARGRVVLWNEHATQLFGYTADQMMGEPLDQLIPERFREGHHTGIERVVGGGERHVIGQTVELAALDHNGREFPMELSLATWEAEGERLFIGIIRDITERKKAEHALHLANKSLSEKNHQLESLSGKLAKYLSRQVYDSIFEGRKEVRVESYRKELTVFFSDIQGFTDLTDRLEAEPLSELLNSYLSDMATIADEHGGTVDKFIGDGIMIFFGDPSTRGRREDARACIRMALAMRNRIGELQTQWSELAGAIPLNVRMGINTGYCTVGNFGSEERLDYTIVGGPVNVASRLESTAEPNQIHISYETYSLVKDEFYCRPTGDMKAKGVAHEISTFEVVGSFGELRRQKAPIHASARGFDLNFDPAAMAAQETALAREALNAALAALDDADATT